MVGIGPIKNDLAWHAAHVNHYVAKMLRLPEGTELPCQVIQRACDSLAAEIDLIEHVRAQNWITLEELTAGTRYSFLNETEVQ